MESHRAQFGPYDPLELMDLEFFPTLGIRTSGLDVKNTSAVFVDGSVEEIVGKMSDGERLLLPELSFKLEGIIDSTTNLRGYLGQKPHDLSTRRGAQYLRRFAKDAFELSEEEVDQVMGRPWNNDALNESVGLLKSEGRIRMVGALYFVKGKEPSFIFSQFRVGDSVYITTP